MSISPWAGDIIMEFMQAVYYITNQTLLIQGTVPQSNVKLYPPPLPLSYLILYNPLSVISAKHDRNFSSSPHSLDKSRGVHLGGPRTSASVWQGFYPLVSNSAWHLWEVRQRPSTLFSKDNGHSRLSCHNVAWQLLYCLHISNVFFFSWVTLLGRRGSCHSEENNWLKAFRQWHWRRKWTVPVLLQERPDIWASLGHNAAPFYAFSGCWLIAGECLDIMAY